MLFLGADFGEGGPLNGTHVYPQINGSLGRAHGPRALALGRAPPRPPSGPMGPGPCPMGPGPMVPLFGGIIFLIIFPIICPIIPLCGPIIPLKGFYFAITESITMQPDDNDVARSLFRTQHGHNHLEAVQLWMCTGHLRWCAQDYCS